MYNFSHLQFAPLPPKPEFAAHVVKSWSLRLHPGIVLMDSGGAYYLVGAGVIAGDIEPDDEVEFVGWGRITTHVPPPYWE